jgi:hypothetical protein
MCWAHRHLFFNHNPLVNPAHNNQIDHRSQESFSFAREIAQPWGGLDLVLSWCRQEITGDWRWQLVTTANDISPGRYIFYFDESRDAVAFVIKWG